MSIKAIETRYKGYRFRSRLEARWAVFFDALGLEWQYEIEGFKKGAACYLPDFHLPKSNTWVEVKGSDELLSDSQDRLESFLDFGCPMPGFDDSRKPQDGMTLPGLLILGDVPEPKWGLTFHRIIQHSKGLYFEWAFFSPTGPQSMYDRLLDFFRNDEPDWTTKSRFVPTPCAWNEVVEAYRAARSARFEHGESG